MEAEIRVIGCLGAKGPVSRNGNQARDRADHKRVMLLLRRKPGGLITVAGNQPEAYMSLGPLPDRRVLSQPTITPLDRDSVQEGLAGPHVGWLHMCNQPTLRTCHILAMVCEILERL